MVMQSPERNENNVELHACPFESIDYGDLCCKGHDEQAKLRVERYFDQSYPVVLS